MVSLTCDASVWACPAAQTMVHTTVEACLLGFCENNLQKNHATTSTSRRGREGCAMNLLRFMVVKGVLHNWRRNPPLRLHPGRYHVIRGIPRVPHSELRLGGKGIIHNLFFISSGRYPCFVYALFCFILFFSFCSHGMCLAWLVTTG